jgi:protein-disulfide isomerase
MGKTARENVRQEEMRRRNRWILWVGISAFLAGIVWVIMKNGSAPTVAPQPLNSPPAPAITASDWTRGNKSAKVTLIEYGDFECPACATYYPFVKQIAEDYADRILFVFRNFPLYQIHPNAGISAQAAESAGLQGKYWEMHDLLYEKQNDWSSASPDKVVQQYFDGYASSLGLDMNKFSQEVNSSAVMNKIKTDVDGGTTAQIDHTPTFFVNLKQIQNPRNYDEFKTILDHALQTGS